MRKQKTTARLLLGFIAVKYRAPNQRRRRFSPTLRWKSGEARTVALLGPKRERKKTTLLKLVNRLLKPTACEILCEWAGDRRGGSDSIAARNRYVIQEGGLFPHYTVAENIGLVPGLEGWAPGRIGARVAEMMRLVGLEPGEYAGRKTARAFGGQRQRVGVAAGFGCGSRDIVDG